MLEVVVHSLGMEQVSNQPVVILRAVADGRMLPIWIGESEAKAILVHYQEEPFPRPLTHDLLHNTILALGFLVERIEITELRETTFYANIVLFDGANTVEIDARPSDAIALAVRAGCPILVAEDVMEIAGRDMIAEEDGEGQAPDAHDAFPLMSREPEEEEVEVEQFREFLAHVDPEDFASSS
jgi:uncharacterized protein